MAEEIEMTQDEMNGNGFPYPSGIIDHADYEAWLKGEIGDYERWLRSQAEDADFVAEMMKRDGGRAA